MPAESPFKRPFRILAGGAIFFLIAMLLIAVYDPPELSDGTRKALGWVSVAIVLATVSGAMWLSTRQGLWNLQRNCRVNLSDGKISEIRAASPVVEIPLNQIQSLHEGHGWLVVRSGEPVKQIAIPLDIGGIDELKRELAQFATVAPLKFKRSPSAFVSPVLGIVALIFLFVSRNRSVVMVAGGLFLLLQGWEMYSLRRFFPSKRKIVFLILAYILTFLAVALVIYRRAIAVM